MKASAKISSAISALTIRTNSGVDMLSSVSVCPLDDKDDDDKCDNDFHLSLHYKQKGPRLAIPGLHSGALRYAHLTIKGLTIRFPNLIASQTTH